MPTALIVEDEVAANRLLAMLVQLRGYATESAFTGGEALEKVGSRRPNIVFLDLMLPDTNGFEVCQAIKTRRETHPTPIVVVTARLAAENRAQGSQVGANEYIPKPYTPDQIFASMARADAWKRGIVSHPDEGEIPLDAREEVKTFEQVSLLWSLLLARTPWDEEEVRQLVQSLMKLVRDAGTWGRRNQADHVAALRYRLRPDRVSISVHDDSGWFSLGAPPRELLGDLIAGGRFDAVADDGNEVLLTKQFADGAGTKEDEGENVVRPST